MACTLTIAGRAFPCKTGIGGIKRVWIGQASLVDWDVIATGAVAGLAGASTATLYGIELTKNTGSFQQTVTASVENGTIFYSQVLELYTPVLDAVTNDNIAEILTGRLAIIVQDNNDNMLVMGYATGAEVTGGTFGTGTAKGDQNGYQLQFTAEELAPSPFLASTAGVPTDSDITLTEGT